MADLACVTDVTPGCRNSAAMDRVEARDSFLAASGIALYVLGVWVRRCRAAMSSRIGTVRSCLQSRETVSGPCFLGNAKAVQGD